MEQLIFKKIAPLIHRNMIFLINHMRGVRCYENNLGIYKFIIFNELYVEFSSFAGNLDFKLIK